jgi:hypothetical protein
MQEILLILSNPSELGKRLFIAFRSKYIPNNSWNFGMLLFLLLLTIRGHPLNTSSVLQQYFCELRGSCYIEEYPERANFLVYEEDSEAFADLLIFETDNALFADKPGIWYFTDDRAFADFSVYFVDSKGNADFTVYFTRFESFAGCNN